MADPNRAYEFAMGFVSASSEYRGQFVDKWQEVLSNFIVQPNYDASYSLRSPYRRNDVYKSSKKQIVLKDPETHKLVMTYASKLMRTIFGDMHHEYVRARPTGWEDAEKGRTVTRLLRYDFQIPGHFRTLAEAVIDMILFGTSVVEVGWRYQEEDLPVRTVGMTMSGPVDTVARQRVVTYDDVCLRNIDLQDFYPDPGRYRLDEMGGAAKRFRMNAQAARALGDHGLYLPARVEEAIGKGASGVDPAALKDNVRAGQDQPEIAKSFGEFDDMIGYEYWGILGDDVEVEDEDGKVHKGEKGVITVLNNVVVRQDLWPLTDCTLPFKSLVINPVVGRFYGISPAEVVRFDQSFADALKILLAEAVIRQVHPPIAFDSSGDPDIAALKAWKADALIGVNGGPNSIGTVRYDANVQQGFAMLSGLQAAMQGASGALGGIQGESGPDREAASVGVQRLQFAMDRPELAGAILEKECLPPIAKSMLRRNQQFLDEEGLAQRIGEQPAAVWIGDIMADYDVEFVGSRMSNNRQQKLQAFQTLASLAAVIPAFQMVLPTIELAQEITGDLLELPEVAARIGQDQGVMATNLMAMMAMGNKGGPAQNGVPEQGQPPGALPAQMAGY